MHIPKKLFGLIMTAVLSMMIGCDKNENARLAQMADEHLQRQAEQNRQMSDLHLEVAEGSRRLVEADAKARQEMVAAPRQLQILQTVLRPVGVKGFVVLPKRWIVERTFAWIGRCRRHSKDYERNPETSETMIYISMIALMSKRLAGSKN